MEPPNFQDLTNIFKFQEENTVIEEPKSKNKSNLNEVDRARVIEILSSQCKILTLPDDVDWIAGRLKACAATITACLKSIGEPIEEVEEALAAALQESKSQPLANWLNAFIEGFTSETIHSGNKSLLTAQTASLNVSYENNNIKSSSEEEKKQQTVNAIRADLQTGKFLKVDQAKIDRLMNLISEMVVAKNALPYLANRAEKEYGAHSFSKEIKNQYTIINRITQEMQDAIMQVRMMPVSFIFQRFSRLVRDISHKLGKEVNLVIEGEETEADKDIIEMLADPLIHIIRNSLDHGLESPDERSACGKPTAGRLTIRAIQESDRLIIEIIDDGRGIDLNIVKRVAYEKGVIDEIKLETISDQEAINLIFLPGFSTAKSTSDLSGRGVGMDVVRNTINKLGGTIDLKSEIGKGTTVRLSIPFSLAVTNVMIIETGEQIFGVPMEFIVETVRIVDSEIRTIKRQKTSSLRGRIVPILALNDLLNLSASPRINEEGKYAVLIVKVGTEEIGLLVDDFHEVIDVILKPMPGHLGKISYYAGTAILGDGSVLLVLNLKELINGHRI
jgi:two-component system chemotaxis sensor kinase CheA